jgi:predicted transcriptional regulator of viral defense system
MVMSESAIKKAIEVFRQHDGVMATRQAVESGVHYRTLYEMRDQGILDRLARGRYRLAELPPLTNPDLATVALRIPRGVICLISALAFHGLTTEVPHDVYIALPRGSEEPRLGYPPIRVFKFSGQAFTEGIESHEIDSIRIRVYCPAKTIADCFKFRNKIGIDAVIEALKFYRGTRRFDVNELMEFARICRVDQVMRPYVEAVL